MPSKYGEKNFVLTPKNEGNVGSNGIWYKVGPTS